MQSRSSAAPVAMREAAAVRRARPRSSRAGSQPHRRARRGAIAPLRCRANSHARSVENRLRVAAGRGAAACEPERRSGGPRSSTGSATTWTIATPSSQLRGAAERPSCGTPRRRRAASGRRADARLGEVERHRQRDARPPRGRRVAQRRTEQMVDPYALRDRVDALAHGRDVAPEVRRQDRHVLLDGQAELEHVRRAARPGVAGPRTASSPSAAARARRARAGAARARLGRVGENAEQLAGAQRGSRGRRAGSLSGRRPRSEGGGPARSRGPASRRLRVDDHVAGRGLSRGAACLSWSVGRGAALSRALVGRRG